MKQNADTAEISAKIQEMVARIVERFQPQKIILFGSHAHGTAGTDSDVDLLVVFPAVASRRKMAVEIYRLLAGSGIPKDIIVTTSAEVARFHDVVGTIIREALAEGKILYERSA